MVKMPTIKTKLLLNDTKVYKINDEHNKISETKIQKINQKIN